MVIPINNLTAWLFIVLYTAPFAAFTYRRRTRPARERRQLNTKRIRAWRKRMIATADQPFELRLLSAFERKRLINHRGLTTDQWFGGVIAEFRAGTRTTLPTCGDYLDQFGSQPTVRPAETRTHVRDLDHARQVLPRLRRPHPQRITLRKLRRGTDRPPERQTETEHHSTGTRTGTPPTRTSSDRKGAGV